jgi:hypothetical protein
LIQEEQFQTRFVYQAWRDGLSFVVSLWNKSRSLCVGKREMVHPSDRIKKMERTAPCAMKIDVQRFEIRLLQGATQILMTQQCPAFGPERSGSRNERVSLTGLS